MIADIRTVMWKERKSLFRQQGSRARILLTLLLPMIMVAIWLPWLMGPDWVEGYESLFSSIAPMMMVLLTVPDSFAGERERHTLSTLLASRLPDRAIFFGKLAVSIGLGFGMMIIVLLLALVTVNLVHWDGHVMLYSYRVVLVDLAFSLVLSVLIASAGVLISLRASTVQEAQQMLGAAVMVPPMVIGVVLLALREQIAGVLGDLDIIYVVLIVMAVLVVACAGLLAAAMARFQRARLILS